MISFLIDPLYRGPFWGSLLLSTLLALVGVIVYLARRPLLGEVVAHSSYPGAILGLIFSIFTLRVENPVFVLVVAFVFAWLGMLVLSKIQTKATIDSAMTLVLSGFFGLGVLISSVVQQKYAKFYRIAQGYLFGQITTMNDQHIWLYAIALLVTGLFIWIFYSRLKLFLFDPEQSKILGGKGLGIAFDALVCAVIVLGIRGIGVVLVSSFFVAPGIFASRFSQTFKQMLIWATVLSVGMSFLSFIMVSKWPLGPLIVLGLSLAAFMTLRKKTHASL